MAQSIKSLTSQFKDVKVEGFKLTELRKGDYGYNMALGLVDDEIEVGFKIFYEKDGDDTASANIQEAVKCNVDIVRLIAKKFAPKDSKLVKFIDGETLFTYDIGFEVDGKRIYFTSPQSYLTVNHPSYKPPILYSAQEAMDILKSLIEIYIKNFKILLKSKKLKFLQYEMAKDGETIFENGKQRFIHYSIITCEFSDKQFSFVVKNFEKENIKKRLKQEFKNAKNNKFDETCQRQKVIDLRSFPEVVEAYNKIDRLENMFSNAHKKYNLLVRKGSCEGCKNYNTNKDIHGWYFDGYADVEGRFSTCRKDCEFLAELKAAMQNMNAKKKKFEEFATKTFFPTMIKFFEETNPNFIYWKTCEVLNWKDIFSDEENILKHGGDRCLRILLDSGFNGLYIWEGDVITLRGETTTDDRKELLTLGKDVEHNIREGISTIKDDYLTIDKNGKICYNHAKDGDVEEYNRNTYNATVRDMRFGLERLTKNYDIFKTPQDKYIVNSILAIYHSFFGEDTQAKMYKAVVENLPVAKFTKDERIEKLLKNV